MSAYYTIPQFAERLGMPLRTAYRYAEQGKFDHLGAIRIGRKTYIPKSVIDTPEVAA